jgi:hypothetical protein
MPPKAADAAPVALAPKDEVNLSPFPAFTSLQRVLSHTASQFEFLVKLTVSVRCVPINQPPPAPASAGEQPAPASASPPETSDDITASGIKFKLSVLGVSVPIESQVAPSRDFKWDAAVELISSDAWAQQMAVDEESHVAVSMAGAAAPVVLLPVRLASLMGREKSNTTQITVDNSALGQAPVLMSTIFVTVTRETDMLSPALMDRLNPLTVTIVRCCFFVVLRQCHKSEALALAGERLLHAQRACLLPTALRLLRPCIRRVRPHSRNFAEQISRAEQVRVSPCTLG